MKVLSITDKVTWEAALDELAVTTSFFQSYNWGEFEKVQQHEVMRYAFYDSNDVLNAVAQMFLVAAKRGRYLHVRNGPVFVKDINPKNLRAVIDELKVIATKQACDFVRISPLLEKKPENSAPLFAMGLKPSQMHDVDAEVTWLLNLEQPAEEILKGMRDSHRYLTRKALKMTDLEIIKTQDLNMVKEFWPIYEETFKRQQWTAYKLPYLEKEFEIFAKDNQVNLFLAKYQGKFIAASMFIYYRDQVFYHHSGSLTEFRNIPAMYRIHWESILEAQARGIKTYNFFGIARTDEKKHPWAGLTQFKKGFGGQQQEWLHAMDIPLKPKYWFTHYYELLERKKRGYR